MGCPPPSKKKSAWQNTEQQNCKNAAGSDAPINVHQIMESFLKCILEIYMILGGGGGGNFFFSKLQFLYPKKQKFNKQLYETHLKCANKWQNNWSLITEFLY
jgi:hypothetical protein